jgi:glycosyltransferase involved in cell wall biosynthesis
LSPQPSFRFGSLAAVLEGKTKKVDRAATEKSIRALHVAPGLELSDGGPSYSVPGLCRYLAAAGADVSLLSATRGGEFASMGDCSFDHRFPAYSGPIPFLNRLRLSPGLARELDVEAGQTDVVHNHGLWLIPNLLAGRAAVRHRKPLIVAPHGMLSPVALSFSGIKKKVFWHLLQKAPVKAAACIHATSLQEYRELRALSFTNPVAIVPNGIDIPESPRRYSEQNKARVVLSLGRIHPKKGLDHLVRAWAKVELERPEWRLRIVGPAELKHDEELRALSKSLGLRRVSIEGPLYGKDKLAAFHDADLFVLATLNENFAMTVAEALAAEVPVISTKGAPWAGLKQERCGWWIDHGVEPMVAALRAAMQLSPNERRAMGKRGREWMARAYSWERVAADMLDVYRWVSTKADPPESVRFD